MTREVFIQIEGIQHGAEEERIVTEAAGIYHLHKDKHYIHYEEEVPEENTFSKNSIKIGTARIELTKKGKSNSHMAFDLKEDTEALYQTPYGSLCFGVNTKGIHIDETPERLIVRLEYVLSTNGVAVSENMITLTIDSVKAVS